MYQPIELVQYTGLACVPCAITLFTDPWTPEEVYTEEEEE